MNSIDFQVHSKPKQTNFLRRWTDLHKESALHKRLFTHPSIPKRRRGQILPSKSLKRRRPRHPWFLQTRSVTRIHRVGSVHFSRCFQVSYLSGCVWEYPAVSPSRSLCLSLRESFCARDGEAGGCCLRKRSGGARASSPHRCCRSLSRSAGATVILNCQTDWGKATRHKTPMFTLQANVAQI